MIARLESEVAARPDERHILSAPLPCDLPSIFYMDRRGFRVPLNARPEPGERVWLIARKGEPIESVLGSGLINAADLADAFTDWQPVAEFRTLNLFTAVRRPSAALPPTP